jgi:uncharacterized membrane protein YjgN (DUF898 family)
MPYLEISKPRRRPWDPKPHDSAGDAVAEAPGVGLAFTGTEGDALRLFSKLTLIIMVTAGVYRFWAKAAVRQFLWGHLEIDKEPLEYTGNGLELFRSFLIVVSLLAPLFLIASIAPFILSDGDGSLWEVGLFGLVWVVLMPLGAFQARRYRLSRTLWRGVRGAQGGSAMRYLWITFSGYILLVLTAGFSFGNLRARQIRYLNNNVWMGDQRMQCDLPTGRLTWLWIGCYLLLPFTLGISYIAYRTIEARRTVAHVRIADLGFKSELPTTMVVAYIALFAISMGLAWAVFSAAIYAAATAFGAIGADILENIATTLGVFSIVLLAPPIRLATFTVPLLRKFMTTLTVTGVLRPKTIGASPITQPGGGGEGLAALLDFDVG